MKIAKSEIKQRVENCVVDVLRISSRTFQINKGLTWYELGADSLQMVELIMAFEEEFEIEISDELAETIKTPKQAIKHFIKTYS